MNLVDCIVIEILSDPFYEFDRWWVKVKYDSYGVTSETQIMFYQKEETEKVKVGYKFLA